MGGSANKDVFGRPGSDLLSRALRQSTIGAEAFHDRVRDGIGCSHFAITTRSAKHIFLCAIGILCAIALRLNERGYICAIALRLNERGFYMSIFNLLG